MSNILRTSTEHITAPLELARGNMHISSLEAHTTLNTSMEISIESSPQH